jgi:hypothetical protein
MLCGVGGVVFKFWIYPFSCLYIFWLVWLIESEYMSEYIFDGLFYFRSALYAMTS